MYPLKNWLRGNPRAPLAADSARRILALVFVACLALLPVSGAEAQGQGTIRVLSTTEDYSFSESLRFGLQAQSSSPIVEAILFYGVMDEPLVRRIYPVFAPGTEVQISHTERIEPGQFAPGTRLRSWWRRCWRRCWASGMC